MRELIQLDSKDVRKILAHFFGVNEKQIVPQRYSFAIEGVPIEQVQERLGGVD